MNEINRGIWFPWMRITRPVEGLTMDYMPRLLCNALCAASIGALFLAGCASSVPPDQAGRVSPAAPQVSSTGSQASFTTPQGPAMDPPATPSSNGARVAEKAVPETNEVVLGQDDSTVLEALWAKRSASASDDKSSDLTLGPGDVLRISLPQLDTQTDRMYRTPEEENVALPPNNNGPYTAQGDLVRVSEEDTIALPLLGVINVSGMTEADLRNELIRRVGNYVYKPQVEVFLEHSENRDVAVLGSVKTPGRYMMTSPSDTIMTMISHAGGMTDDSASRVILVPAHASGKPRLEATSLTSSAPVDGSSATQVPDDQVLINLARAGNQRYLELPVRPGDVIIVPAAGEVTVEGWVPNPGHFKITPGMTALGAIAAAGGAQFTSSATLLREAGNGGKYDMPLDISKLKSGAEPDVPLQGGDVVVVERSVVGAVPYTLYFLISHVGLGFPVM